MYEIEKHVQIPGNGRRKYPFQDMGVGDSFFVSSMSGKNNIARVAATNYGKRNNIKFLTRMCIEDGVAGMRIWRVA